MRASRVFVSLSTLLAAAAIVAPIAAAAPSNDAFEAALPLAVGTETIGENVAATSEVGEPNPTGFGQASGCATISTTPNCGTSVWYLFEPAASGEYTIETCDGGSDVVNILGVYTGTSVAALTEVTSADSSGKCPKLAGRVVGSGSQVSFMATAGTVYHLDVVGNDGLEGAFYLRAYGGAPVARPQPDTAIVSGSSLASTRDTLNSTWGAVTGPRHSASFALASSPPGASFECSLDGAAFAPCEAAVSYDDLAPGTSHEFFARAKIGAAIDPTPALERFTIDTTPPDTAITSGPTGDLASQTAKWTASGSERFNRGFILCGIDSMPFEGCSGSLPTSYASLCAGAHTFRAAGVDNASNVDPTPATATVNVTTGPACAPPTIGSPESSFVGPTYADLLIPMDNSGAGGTLGVEFGPTTAYGRDLGALRARPGEGAVKAGLPDLDPDTIYHYRVTLKTPFGTAATPDETVVTAPANGGVPSIVNGTPVVAGQHAATIPATFDPAGKEISYRLRITPGAPETGSGALFGTLLENEIPAGAPREGRVSVVDLEPATTYNYRFIANQAEGGNAALGPEGSFTTPPYPEKKAVKHKMFRIRRSMLKIGRLTHRSHALKVAGRRFPKGTAVGLKLTLGKSKASRRIKANARGRFVARLKIKGGLRRALRDTHLKALKLTVTAKPPGENRARLALRVKVR